MTDEETIANESYHTCGRCKYDTLPENMYPCNQCIHSQDTRKDLWVCKAERMTCDRCKHFKILYEPLRTTGELWDMGRAKCDKHNLTIDFSNHKKFKWLDACGDFEPKESEVKE